MVWFVFCISRRFLRRLLVLPFMYYPVVSGPESLTLDATVIHNVGIRSIVLMEKAADAVIAGMVEFFGRDSLYKSKIAIVCGTGNNGADGLVVARNLVSRNVHVDVFLVSRLGDFSMKSDEGKENMRLLLDDNFMPGLSVTEWTPDSVPPNLTNYDIVIDALFGAGFNLSCQMNDFTLSVLSHLADHPRIVAVDVPSGQCPTTGRYGHSQHRPIKAALTVTFGAIKSGLVTYPGKTFAGKIFYSPISFPRKILQTSSSCELIVPMQLVPRDPNGYKSTFGSGLFVSGSKSYLGAPMFCSGSFLRCGGGYARLASLDPDKVHPVVASQIPEIVFLDTWSEKLGDSDVIVIGPGLGRSPQAVSTLRSVLESLSTVDSQCQKNRAVSALIIDGDGLGLLLEACHNDPHEVVRILGQIMQTECPVILTPHLGELRTLFWPSAPDIKSTFPHSIDLSGSNFLDYVYSTKAVLVELVSQLPQLIVVVKGSTSCVVDGTHSIRMNVTGNSGMGTAGSGDVLCGVIANIVERNRRSRAPELTIDAVATAVWIHGRAGDIAKDTLGEDGMLASDIMNALPAAIREVYMGESNKWKTYYPTVL